MKKRYYFSLLLICILSMTQSAKGQIAVQIRDFNVLYLIDMQTNSENLFYTSSLQEIRSVKISSDEQYIAILEVDYSGDYPVNTLKVLSISGNEVYIAPQDVQRYIWSPNSNRLAFITGPYYEGGKGFNPQGFYITEIPTAAQKKIETNGFAPYDINWVSNDIEESIYVASFSADQKKQYLKYNLSRNRFETINFRSSDISPDSEFYAIHDYDSCQCVRIFSTKLNEEKSNLTLSSTDIPVGWAYNASHLYVIEKLQYSKKKKDIVIAGEVRQATVNGPLSSAIVEVKDGQNGNNIQRIEGILPDRLPYQSLFFNRNILLTISKDVTPKDARTSGLLGIGKISVNTIPNSYK